MFIITNILNVRGILMLKFILTNCSHLISLFKKIYAHGVSKITSQFYGQLVIIKRKIGDFKGDNLIIACGKDSCKNSELHKENNFYSIDRNSHMNPDIVCSIQHRIPDNIIPKNRFSFIYFERIANSGLFNPGSYALINASSILKNDGVTLLDTGSSHEKHNKQALDSFIETLKKSGFKYGINLVDVLFENTSLDQKVTGIRLLLSNNLAVVKLNQFPEILSHALRGMSVCDGGDDLIYPDKNNIKDEIKLQNIEDLAQDLQSDFSEYQSAKFNNSPVTYLYNSALKSSSEKKVTTETLNDTKTLAKCIIL